MTIFGPLRMKHLLCSAVATVLLTIAAALTAVNASAQAVALTFDDGPNLQTTPLMTPQERNQSILDTLARHQIKAALFVTANNGAITPEGLLLAKAWGQAGHAIGNHTMSHLDLNSDQITLAQYEQEVLDCDQIIQGLPRYHKWFRYTYLRQGNTPEKRDGMRNFLIDHGYRNAYVSLDTSDWRLNEKLIEVLKKNDKADLTPIKTAYLSHIKQRALAYRDLSMRLQGRDIAQVILLHHNLINALWLDDAIRQFQDMGWHFVSPEVAFADPVYQLDPERLAAGQSLLLSMSRVLGLGKFNGWTRLVDDGDTEIAWLTSKGY